MDDICAIKERSARNTKIVILILLPFVMGVSLQRCEWQGPSEHFTSLDRDGNGELSLNEWMAYYGSAEHDHAWNSCYGSDFEPADCDFNQSLTWHEYAQMKFGRKACDDQASYGNLFTEQIVRRPIQQADTGEWNLVPITKIYAADYCRYLTRMSVRPWKENDFDDVLESAEKRTTGVVVREVYNRVNCAIYQE